MYKLSVVIAPLGVTDLPFLLALWREPEVMRYADEFPRLRGWSKADDPQVAWQRYQAKRAALGPGYTQLILSLEDHTRIGESFFTPLPEGYTFGKWQKPAGILTLLGDIKLLPPFWGRGLGTAGMRRIVKWLFANTPGELLLVPPHRKNPAAQRVYEKAGFELYRGMTSWYGHKVMTLSRERVDN